jgi:cell division septal protein FtsQ
MFFFRKKKKQYGYVGTPVKTSRLSPFVWQGILGLSLMLLLVCIISALWYVTSIERFQIRSVEVIGGTTIPHEQVRSATLATLSGTYMRLIPHTFIPTYPKKDILQAVESIPRIKNIHIAYSTPKTLSIAFDEYIPFALWCERADAPDCLFMEKSGFAFSEAPRLEGSAFMRLMVEGKKPELKTLMLKHDLLENVYEFSELLSEDLSLFVTAITFKGDFDVEYTLSGGGVIKTSQKDAPEKIFENLQTILASKEFVHIAPGDFEYIDLRFGDKVFVREVPVAASSSATTTLSAE